MPRDAASKAAARRRSTAWAARCSAAVERSPAAQATPTPRSAGISHSSTTLSNEPRLKRSSRIAASRAVSRSRAASTSSLSARSPSAHSPPAGRSRAGASSSARDTSSAAWRGDQPVATLRAWERRYGVVAPERTVGGYRLYDEPTLARIRAMRDLVATGWSPRQAADEVSRADDDALARDLPAVEERADTDRADSDRAETDRADSELVDAARDLDTTRLAAILDDRFSRGSFESVVDEWLMPALRGVGDAWAAGDLSTAAEHLAAHAVLRRLAAQHGVGGQVPVSYTHLRAHETDS